MPDNLSSYRQNPNFGLDLDFTLEKPDNMFSNLGKSMLGDKLKSTFTKNVMKKMGTKLLGKSAMSSLSKFAGPAGWLAMGAMSIYGGHEQAKANRAKSKALSASIDATEAERLRDSAIQRDKLTDMKESMANTVNTITTQKGDAFDKVESMEGALTKKSNLDTGSIDVAINEKMGSIEDAYKFKADNLFANYQTTVDEMGEKHRRNILQANQSIKEMHAAKEEVDDHSRWYQNLV